MVILSFVAGALALALTLALHPGPATLAFAALALGAALLPLPRRAVVLAVLGAVLLLTGPAFAQTAGAADPMPWLTALLDRGAGWLIGGALSGVAALLYRFGKIVIPAVVESRIRQTALTGAHVAIVELESELAHSWTPERRRIAVGKVVAWTMDRMPFGAARLKLSQQVVTGIALKMLNQALAGSVPTLPAVSASPIVGMAGAVLGAMVPDAPAIDPSAACSLCGADDPERMERGCTRDGCPKVHDHPDLPNPLASLAAGAAGAAALLGSGLQPG